PVPAQLVASTVALWNPYLAERLLQGHWSLLTGYAALPWIILTANRIRVPSRSGHAPGTPPDSAQTDPVRKPDSAPSGSTSPVHRVIGTPADSAGAHNIPGRRAESAGAHSSSGALRDWGGLAGALAAAGLTPTGAVLGAVTALVVVGRRRFAWVAGLVVLASVPWLLATAVSGSGSEPSDPAGIAAFAARAEPGLGTLGSLAGLGGIWNGDAVPATRTTLLAVIGTLLLLTIVATGLRSVWTAQGNRYVQRALLVLAALAILLPALGATPWGMHLLEWLVAHVPGTGLLRDTQKYVALAMPAYALCAAASCMLLAARFRSARNAQSPDTTAAQQIPSVASPSTPTVSAAASHVAPLHTAPSRALTRTVASVFIVLLVLPLLDLAWGVAGALRPVHYPAGWREVAERVD
ncbi:hypothetical protein ACWIG5_40320, partial [Streptomyces lydicus]